jgi:hypothetical protein
MNKLIQGYTAGWIALLKGGLVATVWALLVLLPVYAFCFIFPDQMEGKAPGAKWIRPICTIVLLIWAPILAGALGPLQFYKRKKPEGANKSSEPT